ncbi:MAG: hypothetical protein KGZ50_01440, partial [Peptococcaceae bacterium]|nr:hypothetical protein [Peptococcaceae bacterium]
DVTEFIGSSLGLVIPLEPSALPLYAGSSSLTSRFWIMGYIVPSASHPAVTSYACDGRLPMRKHRV